MRVEIYTKYLSPHVALPRVQTDPDPVITEKDLSLQMRIHW